MTSTSGFGRWWLLIHGAIWICTGLAALPVAVFMVWSVAFRGAPTWLAGAVVTGLLYGGFCIWLGRHAIDATQGVKRSASIVRWAARALLGCFLILVLVLAARALGEAPDPRSALFDRAKLAYAAVGVLDFLLILRILSPESRIERSPK